MRNGIEAAAFDLDGTLYPNYRLYVRLLPFIFKELPLLRAFGRARTIIRAGQDARSGTGPAPLSGRGALRGAGLSGPPPAELFPDFYDYQAAITADILGAPPALVKEKTERLIYRGWEPHFKKIRLFPYVKETLAALRQAGFRLGMLSDFPPETKLAYLGIGDCWDAALCSERLGALKPDRRPFDELAAALGLPPERILYVGNSSRYDVEGAARAGMKTALLTGLLSETGAESRGRTVSPDFIFHDYRQLQDYML
ncbi:MAG: HAD family hydrolase [Treponema sp.]|jgi:putative hydrolase of the HAD superfamily|nr:HAD family hydrolase [Treponema sp.]